MKDKTNGCSAVDRVCPLLNIILPNVIDGDLHPSNTSFLQYSTPAARLKCLSCLSHTKGTLSLRVATNHFSALGYIPFCPPTPLSAPPPAHPSAGELSNIKGREPQKHQHDKIMLNKIQ